MVKKKRVIDGRVYTPRNLAMLAASELYEAEHLAGLGCVREVYDPCCGEGALLDAAREIDSGAICRGIDTDEAAVGVCKAKGHKVDCCDLFDHTPLGEVNKLICNPPYVGRSYIRSVVGDDRFLWLKKTYKTQKAGSCDLAGYVLRHVLATWRPRVSTWIVTNTIAQGSTRRVGLQWALASGYRIVSVLKDIKWPGKIVVHVITIIREDVPWDPRKTQYEPHYQL